jgi:serine/threonine protein kinase
MDEPEAMGSSKVHPIDADTRRFVTAQIPTAVAARFSPRIAELWRLQLIADSLNRGELPLANAVVEEALVDFEQVILVLGDMLSRGLYSTVFRVVDPSNWVVKYQSDCEHLGQLHPLVRNYWFLRELQATGLVPRATFLSAPMRLEPHESVKTAFTIEAADCFTCSTLAGTVRYLVMDRAPMTLSEALFVRVRLPLSVAVKVMIDLVTKLQRMHSVGIVHGNVQIENIVLMKPDTWEVGFIDFGKALFSEEIGLFRVRSPHSQRHCGDSPYQLAGFAPSMRDDVFNAIYVGAGLVLGSALSRQCEALVKRPLEFHKFKADSFLFSLPSTPLDTQVEDIEAKTDILDSLHSILRLARNVAHPMDRPKCEEILNHLTDILLIIQE